MNDQSNYFYALDFAFYNTQGVYDFETQCQMVKELGYDGIHFSAWDGTRWETTRKLASVKEKYGLDVSGIYTVLHLEAGADHPKVSGLLTMLRELEGVKTINLSIQSAGVGLERGDESGDAAVISFLREALAICEERDLEILLYTHLGFWMDRHHIAKRICDKIGHPRLGMVFTGYHWFAIEGGNPAPLLREIVPNLRQVHLSGSRRSPIGWAGVATTEPIDVGECDNLALVATLQHLGYRGPYGYLGWDEGGNPYVKLRRSLAALKEIKESGALPAPPVQGAQN